MSKTQDKLDDVCRRALQQWGHDAQVKMPMEECGELIAAISQYDRGRIPESRLAEEIADVRVCLRQLEMMLNESTVTQEYLNVLDDLDERLGGGRDE